MRERVKWVDVAKALGIFAIYIGHLANYAGCTYLFVIQYHVPLFFFLSGCTDYYDNEQDFWKYCFKKFKSLIIPTWGFGLLSIILMTIELQSTIDEIIAWLLMLLKGNIIEGFAAVPLWFLICLFVIQVIFKLLKYLKAKVIIFLMCTAMHMVAVYCTIVPSLYHLDKALYYIIFYAVGYIAYPFIMKLFELDTKAKILCFAIGGILSLPYTAMCFFCIDLVPLTFVLKALVLIWFNLVAARLLSNVELLQRIGKETLYLCGNEVIVKTLVADILLLFEINVNLANPLIAYLYTFMLLVLNIKVVIPCEKYVWMQVKTGIGCVANSPTP